MRGLKMRVLMTAVMMAIGTIVTHPGVARATLDCDDPDNAEFCGGGGSGPGECCTAKNGASCCGYSRCVALDWMCSAY